MKRRDFIVGAANSAGILLLEGAKAATPCPPILHGANSPIACPNEAESDLAAAAAGMSSGEVVDFSGRGMTSNLVEAGGQNTILEFATKGYWDEDRRLLHFVGGGHTGISRHIQYNDSTDAWETVQDGIGEGFAHAYEHLALNTFTGDLYFRRFYSDNVQRRQPGGSWASWSRITTLGGSYQDACALEFHPWIGDEGGLVYVDGDWGVHVMDISAGKWSKVSSEDFAHPHNAAAYLPKRRVLFVGGGNNDGAVPSEKIRQIDSDGNYTTRNNAPYAWGPSDMGVMIADPGPKGEMLLFARNGNVYELDYDADLWSVIDTHPFYDGIDNWLFLTPITTYGVVMGVSLDNPPRVRLWKR